MPPCWNPHDPRWPSPTSPIEWCSITYAVPGSSGPAHVPITPFTVSMPLIASDSNQSFSRSVTLIVNSRVTSPTPRTPSLRIFHAVCALRQQVAELRRADVRRHAQQQRPEHVGDALHPRLPLRQRLGVLLRELRDRVVGLRRVVRVHRDRAPVGERLEVRAERRDVVAELLQLQLADDRRRHQRHHVGVGRDVDLGVVGERRAGVGGAAGLVPGLQHDGARRRARAKYAPLVRPLCPPPMMIAS